MHCLLRKSNAALSRADSIFIYEFWHIWSLWVGLLLEMWVGLISRCVVILVRLFLFTDWYSETCSWVWLYCWLTDIQKWGTDTAKYIHWGKLSLFIKLHECYMLPWIQNDQSFPKNFFSLIGDETIKHISRRLLFCMWTRKDDLTKII